MRHVGGKVYDGCVSTKAPTCSLVTVRHKPCLSPPLDLWNIPPSEYLPPDAVESPCCRSHDHQHHNINSHLVHSPLYPSPHSRFVSRHIDELGQGSGGDLHSEDRKWVTWEADVGHG